MQTWAHLLDAKLGEVRFQVSDASLVAGVVSLQLLQRGLLPPRFCKVGFRADKLGLVPEHIEDGMVKPCNVTHTATSTRTFV